MRNTFFYNLSLILKNSQIKKNNAKDLLFLSIKNYYLTIKNYRCIKLNSGKDGINFFFNNMYFLNVIQNKTTDK